MKASNWLQISIFYAGTLIITWGLFLFNILVIPTSYMATFLWAPGIMALLCTGIFRKKEELRDLCRHLIPTGKNLKWLLLSVAIPTALIFAADSIYRLFTNQTIAYPASGVPWSFTIVLSIIFGAIGEEIGWRGYLMPALMRKHGLLASSVTTGILWGLWHMGDYGEGILFLLFVVSTIEMSIIMTWLFVKSNRNILTAILFHFATNLSGTLVGFEANLTTRIITLLVYAIPAVLIVVLTKGFSGGSRGAAYTTSMTKS